MTAADWWVLGICWVVISFPAAVLIGRHLRHRSSPDLPPLTEKQVDRLLRQALRKDSER